MEHEEILTYILGGLLAVAGYFIKKVLKDVEDLKGRDIQHALTEQRIDTNVTRIAENEKTMFKKFTSIHTREEKQREINESLKLTLARIDEKLDLLLKAK